MDVHSLPALNATLNATAAILLFAGRQAIASGRRETHRKLMIAAFSVSIAFLISYLIYHAQAGSVPFQGTGPLRIVYFAILISHTVLAASVPFLAVIALRRGLKARALGPKADYASHRKVASWAYPIWLYVSVTGVIVYLMLYWL